MGIDDDGKQGGEIRKSCSLVSNVRFSAVIPDDESTREKLAVMSGIEFIFDDERIRVPDEYHRLCESIQPGDTVEIRIAVKKAS